MDHGSKTLFMVKKILLLILFVACISLSGCSSKKTLYEQTIPEAPVSLKSGTFDLGNREYVIQYIAWRHAILDYETQRKPKSKKKAKISFKRELTEQEFLDLLDKPDIKIETVYPGHGESGGAFVCDSQITLPECLVRNRETFHKMGATVEESNQENSFWQLVSFIERENSLPLHGADIESTANRLQILRDENPSLVRLIDLREPGTYFPMPQSTPLPPELP